MNNNRIVHFEIQAENPERAAKFYSEVFGWDIQEWVIPDITVENEKRYWIVTTAEKDSKDPGINGGILFRHGPAPTQGQPVNAFVCTINVASVDDAVEKAVKAGAQVALPKRAIVGIGWQAYCLDTEGNIFGLHQNDEMGKIGF